MLLSEEEKLFQESVRSFTESEILPHADTWDREGSYPRELFKRVAEQGLLGTSFPEEYGGSGGGALLYAIQCVELAKGSSGVALGIYVHTALASAALLHLGSEEQKQRYLPPAMRGEEIGCWAYAEPGAGSDVSTVSTRAEKRGDTYVLNGSKMYITNAPFADFMIVVASTDPDKGLKGLSLFIVERGFEGVSTGPKMEKLGMGASEMSEIFFEDCVVPEANLLGPEDVGFLAAMKVLTLGRIASAGFAIGLSEAALRTTLEHVRVREQFGGPLFNQQFIRFTLVDMSVQIEASWRLTEHAARVADAGLPHDREASMAKLFATEACTKICERALHLSGAQGYMLESPVQRFYRDCKVLEYGEGSSEIQRETLARFLGGRS
ncbi:MAG: acyl-CoA dehydrogenase family protein [Candidatus Hydrogenedentes bacterium]|nr:acyl-CoA dehydrogenase family protein [Candidatus Hydrogenedentota bacterium]